jgi:hypothetical protein
LYAPPAPTGDVGFSDEPAEGSTSSGNAAQKKKEKTKRKDKDSGPRINWEVRMAEVKRVNNIVLAEEAELDFWKNQRNTNKELSGYGKSGHWVASNVADDEEGAVAVTSGDRRSGGPTAAGAGSRSNTLPQSAGATAAVQGSQSGPVPGKQQDNAKSKPANQPQKGGPNAGKGKPAPAASTSVNDKDHEREGGKPTPSHDKAKYRTKTFDKHHQRDKATKKLGMASGGFN